MKSQLSHNYEDIISIENLLEARKEFIRGKRKKQDVQEFQMRLMDNIFLLHRDLANGIYRHGGYHAFRIADPKPRIIHKASVRDRLLHHVVYRKLHPFMKHGLKARHHIRYADDFILLSDDKAVLDEILPKIGDFLQEELKLALHPDKVFIKTLASGVDFLGWIHFSDHRVLRTATKRRMIRRIRETADKPETVQSYLGMLGHGNARKLQEIISRKDV